MTNRLPKNSIWPTTALMISCCLSGCAGLPTPHQQRAFPTRVANRDAKSANSVKTERAEVERNEDGRIFVKLVSNIYDLEDVEPGDLAALEGEQQTIDLSNALAMGGASNVQVQIARQKVVQAHADLRQARALWLPSLRFGVGWTKHDGRIQATNGDIVEAGRNSLFVGGGAGLGDAPLQGGAGGPPRLMVSLSLADAIFEPYVANRLLEAQTAAESATHNNSLADIALAYVNLVEAQGMIANTRLGLDGSNRLLEITKIFEGQGQGSISEVNRAETEAARWKQRISDAKRISNAQNAELVRLLRLPAKTKLTPAEDKVVPLEFFDESLVLDALLAEGTSNRPEIAERLAHLEAAEERLCQEHWRPWLPNVQVGATGGTFGGGQSANFGSQGSRGDVEVLAVWELRNLGHGIIASRQKRRSELQVAQIKIEAAEERISAEIVRYTGDVASYSEQINSAMDAVESAGKSYQLNLERLRVGDGLPIELLQAIQARVSALNSYTKAVADYNRAQIQLRRATGKPVIGE
jgi:outer membrane protein TolC